MRYPLAVLPDCPEKLEDHRKRCSGLRLNVVYSPALRSEAVGFLNRFSGCWRARSWNVSETSRAYLSLSCYCLLIFVASEFLFFSSSIRISLLFPFVAFLTAYRLHSAGDVPIRKRQATHARANR